MAKLTKAQLAALEREQSLSDDWDTLLAAQEAAEERSRQYGGANSTTARRRIQSPFNRDATPVAEYDANNDTSLVDRAQGSVQRMIGSAMATASDSSNPYISTLTKVPGLVRAVSDPSGRSVQELATTNTGVTDAGNLLKAADANKLIADEAQSARNAARGEGIVATPVRWLDETVGDIVDSPSSLASIAGGPFAAVGAADVYAQTYARARAAGLTKEQATEQAALQGGIEFGMSVIPAGKVLEKLPLGAAVKKKLANELGTIASRTFTGALKTGAGEATEEAVTQVLQTEANRALAAVAEDPHEKKYLSDQLPSSIADYANQVFRAARAGGAAGTALGAPASRFEAIRDAATKASETINAIESNTRNIPNRPEFGPLEPTPAERRSVEEQAIINASNAMIGSPRVPNDGVRQEMASAKRPDKAALLAEAERTAAGVVADAGPQDAQDFISSPVGAVSRTNTIPTSPTNDVDAESISNYNEQLATAVASRIAALKESTSIVGKQESGKKRSAASKKAAAKRAFLLEEQKKVEHLPPVERAQRLADAVQAWNSSEASSAIEETVPNAGVQMPAADVPMSNPNLPGFTLRDRMDTSAPQTSSEAPQQAPVTTAPAHQEREAVRAAEAEEKRQRGIEALMAADPTLSRQEAEDSFAPATTPQTEADIRAAYSGKLNSSGPAPAKGMDANAFIRAIANRVRAGDSKQANVVAKLIRDGKLVVTNNAEELEPGANPNIRGQYDPATGKLYINAAAMDASNPVGSLLQEVASHEVDHAARVSGNTDVRNAVSGILGDTKAARFIEQLKTSSDPIAVEARANAARSGETGERHDLELAAYAMQAASREYANSKGIPALWRGVVSAARTTAQKYIPGVDVNLKDLGYLGQKMLEATATTDKSLVGKGDRLDMVLDVPTATGGAQAEQEGITYLSKDGVRKFVIPDAAARIRPNAARRLLRGETLTLDEVIDHPELFDQMPGTESLPVSMENRPSGNFATYFPDPDLKGGGRVVLSPELLQGETKTTLKEGLLHEVQHHVQNQNDERREHFYNPETDRTPEEQELITRFREVAKRNADATKALMGKVDVIARNAPDNATKRAIAAVQMDRVLTDYGKANEIAGLILDSGMDGYESIANDVLDSYNEYGNMLDAVGAAQASYFQNLTEREAFATQANADNPNPAINPEQADFEQGPVRGKGGKRLNSLAPTPVPAASIPYTPSLAKRVTDFLKSGWFWSGAAGKKVAELSDLQKGFESNMAARAAVYFNKLVPAQEKMANAALSAGKYGSIKEAREGVARLIKDRFDAISNIPDKRRRDTMIARFVQQYPELAPLQEAINDINALTDDYIGQRMRDPKALSEEELAQIKYMHENKSKYLTRVFTAFQGDTGKSYVKKLYKDIGTANAFLAKGKALPAPLKRVFEDYTKAIRFLVRNDVAISDPAHLSALPLDAVRDLYNLWRPTGAQDAEGVQNQMSTSQAGYDEQKYKDYLADVTSAQVSAASQKDYDDRAAQILKNILTRTDSGIARRYLRGSKLDESLLEHRENIPPELRKIYGEITDVPALAAITMARQSVLAARSRMLADLKADHTGELLIEGNNEERSKAGNEKFTEELKGEAWGPLQGMYTTPTLLKALGDYSDSVVDLDTAVALSVKSPNVVMKWVSERLIKTGSGLSKTYKLATVGSGIHIALNAMGSGASLTLAGGVKPQHTMRGMKLALGLIAETAFPEGVAGKLKVENSSDRDDYFRFSIGESAQMQNMRQEPLTILKKIVAEAHTTKTDDVLGFFENIKEKYGMRAYHTLIEIMAQSDAWAKFPIYLQRTNYLENFARANGDPVNIEKIKQEAADYAKDVGMSYDRTAPWLRQAEKIPVIGTFMPYLQSTFRSLTYAALNVYKDSARAIQAKTSQAKLIAAAQAARQAAGLAAVLSAPAIYQAVANAINDDDEEKAIEAEKEFMDDRYRYGNLISMGKDSEGKNLYFQLSRVDARGPVTDIGRVLISDDSPEVKWQAVKEMIKGLWIEPRVGQATSKLFLDIVGDEKLRNKNTRLERMLPLITQTFKNAGTSAGVDSSTMESFIESMDAYVPNALNWFDPKQAKVDNGTAEEVAAGMILAAGGYRLAVADPEKAALYAGLDYENVKNDGRASIASNLGSLSAMHAISDFRRQAAKERRSITKVGRIYQAMLDSGMSEYEVVGTFKEMKIFDSTDMANIRNKTYEANDEEWSKEYSTLLSSQSLKQRLKDNPDAEENIEALKALVDKLGYKKMKENR